MKTFEVIGSTSRTLRVSDGHLVTTRLSLPGWEGEVDSTELAVVLDGAMWRSDMESWRWVRSASDGVERRFHDPNFDDSEWRTVPHLHPIYDSRYPGHAWFRQHFSLRPEHAGETVVLVLGGMDDEDWQRYRLFLNGHEVEGWSSDARWREPKQIILSQTDESYRHLFFDCPNLLAVETFGLNRPLPEVDPAEAEHFFFQGWLLDQFVSVGQPYRVLSDFAVTDVREVSGGYEVDLVEKDIAAIVTYSTGADGHLRKSVSLRNRGGAVRVLDVAIDEIRGTMPEVEKGGRGLPVIGAGFFFGIEHPAGLNQGDEDLLRAVLLLGKTLPAGQELDLPPVVLGVSANGDGAEAFRQYLYGLRPRRSERLTIYDTLGWTDYASEQAEHVRLTDELFEESVQKLEELQHAGVNFDLYEFDDWWDPADFMRFNPAQYKHGSAPLAARLHEIGMESALWSATTQAAWSSNQVPGLETSIAGGVSRSLGWESSPNEIAEWDWNAVFAYVSMGQLRYCWASEPFRSLLRDSLVKHVGESKAKGLKLDCAVLHCTSSDHDHMPGKYSVHAIYDSVLEAVETLRAVEPELFLIWYWGFQSPWWLAHGDIMFDKRMKLEAASPASTPAPSWRRAVSANSDQAVAYASLIPLSLQDSLGTWIGNVPWANWMGKADWQDAFLLDLARGASLVSLWGDLWLFDQSDVAFLRDAMQLVSMTNNGFERTLQLGSPWEFQPYAYLQPIGASGALLTAHNPSFDVRTMTMRRDDFPAQAATAPAALAIYPHPQVTAVGDDALELELLPWEVRCLYLDDALALAPEELPTRRETLHFDSHLVRRSGDTNGSRHVMFQGQFPISSVAVGDTFVVWLRLSRDGAWRYDPEPQSLFRCEMSLEGTRLTHATTPSIRSWNGPGCPWVVFSVPLDESYAGKQLDVSIEGDLPERHEVVAGALAYDAWWTQRPPSLSLEHLPKQPQGTAVRTPL